MDAQKKMTVRGIAWQVLNKCATAEQYSNLALDAAIKRADLCDADRGLLTALVYGVLERGMTLDYWIDALQTKRENAPDPETRTLLRLGLYQLAFLDRVPDHAAVNETVELAPRRTKGFVNAILRAFLRAGKTPALPDPEREPVRYLSVRYSFCPEICETFLETYGRERTESLFAAFEKQPPLTLRVNTLRVAREEFLERLQQAGYTAEATLESNSGVALSGASVARLPGFDEGWFFVQDEASQLCVEALDAAPGMRVLDTCACPGSKSFGAAIEMKNTGELISCDLHWSKLSLVESGARRLGISILSVRERDARERAPEWEGYFDRVLCDVPCSGFGVFAKKPELRYKDPARSAGLPAIQAEILQSSAAFVKPGGLLVYSTCTLLPRENGEVVRTYLEKDPSFELVRERTLYPDVDGTDGFYFAVLKKHE